MAGYSESVDGQEFDAYSARFSGAALIESDEVSSVGDINVWIVVGRCTGLTAKANKTGELMRVNVISVGDARVAPPDLMAVLVEKLGLDVGKDNPRSEKTDYSTDKMDAEGEFLD